MFSCQECGRKFKTAASAERAVMKGCPKCGGTDVDLDTKWNEISRSKRPLKEQNNV